MSSTFINHELHTKFAHISAKAKQLKQEAHGPHRSPEKTVQVKKHI